jgi:hypothetical protein
MMSVLSADPRHVLPNPWRWSAAASVQAQIAWAGALAVVVIAAAVVLLPHAGRGVVALAHVVFHELGHAIVVLLGDGRVHEIAISPWEGHVLHAPSSDTHAALVSLGGLLAPALVAAFALAAGATRQGLEIILLTLAACLAVAARFGVTDSPATVLGLYMLSVITLLVACLPGAALVKASACLAWTGALVAGLWNAAPGLFTEPPLPPLIDDQASLTDVQQLAALLEAEVHDVAAWVLGAQVIIPLFAALWVANWIARYRT